MLALTGIALSAWAPVLAAPAESRAATPFACGVQYSITPATPGVDVAIVIDNRTASAVRGWTLTYSHTGYQTLVQGWNGVWSQSGGKITVTDAGWNATIPAGGGVYTGARFHRYPGGSDGPAGFVVNGTACTTR
ncbi:cellulose binding domain-containing protein [Saccharothrix saharensis]|uniref:cellulose binding domain-containing protein n=1 Tax=Saccharothrix saharensis TaxID=571190 RepID=UPI001FE69477|nr:cellulose binding domain-containing protein [Saccharothrix saharensis]